MNETPQDLVQARKAFSRIGLAFCAILVIASMLQALLIFVPEKLWGPENWLLTSSWGMWLLTFVPLYLVAIPVGVKIMGKLPAAAPEEHALSGKHLLVFFLVGYFFLYVGNILGTVLSMVLSGGSAENAVMNYAMDNNPIKVLFLVILAPLLEEYICRKQIIDRIGCYGEKTAVFFSAIVFGLLHQNLFQFFYAFGMGLVLGYLYIRTGRLRYSVVLHGIINFLGSVIAPALLNLVNLEALSGIDPAAAPEEMIGLLLEILPGLLVFGLYSMVMFAVVIAGLVLLLVNRKKLLWKEPQTRLPREAASKTVYWNVGMVLYILLCAASTVLALV